MRNKLVACVSASVMMLYVSGALAGQDVSPVPQPAGIVASTEVTGTGKRGDPFVFDTSTKCVLKLANGSNATWDLEDAPASCEVIGDVLVFSLAEPGDFIVIAHGDRLYAKAWITIKSGADPPKPVNEIAKRLKAVLVGPDAKNDAKILAGMAGATSDAIASSQLKTVADLGTAWKAAQTANKWPPGKYPGMPDVMRLVMPLTDSMNGTAIIGPETADNLRLLEKTAKEIAGE